MPVTPEFGRFFLPGPTEVRPSILAAQIGPMMGHRTPDTEALVARIQVGLRSLFRTERPVYIAASSATGLMEAAIRNAVRRKVLCLVNGAFSERFARIAAACGLEAEEMRVPWGDFHAPDAVRERLEGGDFDAVTVVHCETSTGVLNPVQELAEVVHASGEAVLLVDAVTSVGGLPVHTDRWGLDFVLTGSQKALALPPGLALGVAREELLERARARGNRGLYFDFLEFERNLERNQTPTTPAVSLLYALDAQLGEIGLEGLDARWRRHSAMARRTWSWVEGMAERGVALSVFAPEGYRSETVTCVRVPDGRTGSGIASALRERGYTVAPGYGPTKDQMFRIGHMGDHTIEELDGLLAAVEEVLEG